MQTVYMHYDPVRKISSDSAPPLPPQETGHHASQC